MSADVEVVPSGVVAELEDLYHENGRLTPADVLARAEQPDSALHDRFTWDDSEAAHLWRLSEARELIRSVKIRVVRGEKTVSVRRYVHIDAPSDPHYSDIDDVAADPVLSAEMLRRMQLEWMAFKSRWQEYSEFLDLIRRDVEAA